MVYFQIIIDQMQIHQVFCKLIVYSQIIIDQKRVFMNEFVKSLREWHLMLKCGDLYH